MTRLTRLSLLALALLALAACAWFVVDGPTSLLLHGGLRGPGREHALAHRSTSGKAAAPSIGGAASAAWRVVGDVLRIVWAIFVTLSLVLTAIAGGLLIGRTAARMQRRYVRLWLVPFRADEATSDDVRRLIESWHQQLLERWHQRLLFGQRSIALEVTMAHDTEGERAACLSVVCPEPLADSVEGSLLACYPDSRLVRGRPGLPTTSEVIRLKKRHRFVWALRPPPEEERGGRNLVDAILVQMTSVSGTAVVQYVLTPTPAAFDRVARQRFRASERRGQQGRTLDPAAPGLRSMVVGEELKGGLTIQHRPLFFADLRVSAGSYGTCCAIAGTIRGGSAGENRLVERHMHGWGRRWLYLDRLRAGVGNPVPGWHRGVVSSTEVAGLWQLPSPGLRTVRVVRSGLPRIPAPPEIARDSALALARDEHGPVGIRPEDKSDGLGLIGGQKTGKTSLLIRTVEADANDREAALVVLMPKPGDATKALSMIPADRTVHYLDLERPELGFNPLLGDGDPAMIADRVVEAFRDVHADGDIRGSSDRYLRQAAQAAVGASRAGVVDGPPTLWHMYRMLLPNETSFREHVVEALYRDSRMTETASFFGRELPGDLEAAASQTSAKLDAPRNKLLRLMVDSLDKVLRHPVQFSFDEIIRRREVLIVDGKMGTFGTDNCRVMMQFLLSGLYGALQRQQQLPEERRVRVAVKVDEAHLIFNESFADALATLRSGGLEVVAAWQYGDQIQDDKVRSGMMSLLRQRCMFSMGESKDAREMSEIAMSVYADMIHADPSSRARLRITPDTIFNLPNHHCVCSWISGGARAAAFIAQTVPLTTNQAIIDHHLAAQRERGCFIPDRLPDPLPDLDWQGLDSLPTAELAGPALGTGAEQATVALVREPRERNGAAAAAPAQVELPATGRNGGPPDPGWTVEPGAATGRSSGDSPTEPFPELGASADPSDDGDGSDDAASNGVGAISLHESSQPDPPRSVSAPDTYRELDLDDVRGIGWDKAKGMPDGRQPELTQRDLEILGALWSYRFLFANQIWRRWWDGSSQRAAQQGLQRLASAGWVNRFKFHVGERGAQQRVYCLTQKGFECARGQLGRHGEHISADAAWRDPGTADPRRILRDLHVNGWVLALQQVAGRSSGAWRGPLEGRLQPPRRRGRGGDSDSIRPAQVVLGSNHRLQGFSGAQFEQVSPDATVELRISNGQSRGRVDLLVDLDRSRGYEATQQRLIAYDGFISGWARMLTRYRKGDVTPMVVFVSEDERSLLRLLKIADEALTTRIAKAGTDELSWPHPGRMGILFAIERDVHEGSLRAVALPERPPEVRLRAGGADAKVCRPRRIQIIDPKLLRRR
jgi:Replication-relaxation